MSTIFENRSSADRNPEPKDRCESISTTGATPEQQAQAASESEIRAIRRIVLIGTITGLLIVGVLIYILILRDYWENEHRSELRTLAEQLDTLTGLGQLETATTTNDNLKDLIGNHAIRDSELKQLIVSARENFNRANGAMRQRLAEAAGAKHESELIAAEEHEAQRSRMIALEAKRARWIKGLESRVLRSVTDRAAMFEEVRQTQGNADADRTIAGGIARGEIAFHALSAMDMLIAAKTATATNGEASPDLNPQVDLFEPAKEAIDSRNFGRFASILAFTYYEFSAVRNRDYDFVQANGGHEPNTPEGQQFVARVRREVSKERAAYADTAEKDYNRIKLLITNECVDQVDPDR